MWPGICKSMSVWKLIFQSLWTQQILFSAFILICQSSKSTGVSKTVNGKYILLSVPISHSSSGNSLPKWDETIINVINSNCASPDLTSQNVCHGGVYRKKLQLIRSTDMNRSNGNISEWAIKTRWKEGKLKDALVNLQLQLASYLIRYYMKTKQLWSLFSPLGGFKQAVFICLKSFQ